MTTNTLTDEDGRKAQYTLIPNFGDMTMTVNTEEAKAFDAEAFADRAYLDFHFGMFIIDAIKKQVQAAYEAGKREAVPVGARDVLAERRRQIEVEGWTPEHDDEHGHGEMALAAGCYAISAHSQSPEPYPEWPWSRAWWRPVNPRRALVKAGALILAEIERLDRSASPKAGE